MVETGQRFGMLTVLVGQVRGSRTVLCLCDCGTERSVQASNLRSGATKSCGCLRRRITGELRRTHGSGNEDYRYRLWQSIKGKCLRESHQDYAYYGGRGIKLHQPWVKDFRAFAAYLDDTLGERPKDSTLDRINNDGHYEPGNLRWATRSEQAFNRRSRWRLKQVDE